MYKFNYNISKQFNNKTIKEFLSYFFLGNEKIKTLSKTGYLFVNSSQVKIDYKLKENDSLTLCLDEDESIKPMKSFLDIIYEDNNLLIINKPAGIGVHSDGAQNIDNTLANMVKYYYDKKKLNIPVWYLHRLDFDTTGIIIFCKDPLSMSKLSNELASHSITRDYLAIVSGSFKDSMIIDAKIGRDRHVNGKYRVSDSGKEAQTSVRVLKEYKHYTLVRLSLKTGRTHQIRVHMSYKGHPLLGDTLYNGSTKYIKRQALHSFYLKMNHPITDEVIELYKDPPYDMQVLLK